MAIGACVVLALLGIIGGRPERFDAKQITVSPAGGEGIRIREVVDQDFGNASRHGYERIIPNDFGVPTDIEAESPDANADIGLSSENFGETRIRLGDADVEYTGQHRYILSYTLPEGELSTGRLDLDIIAAGEEFETGRFEVVITGFELADTECSVGKRANVGGCALEAVGGDYRVVFEPLADGDGVSVVGRITGYTTPVDPPLPALPNKAVDRRALLALAMVPLGLIGSLAVYFTTRLRGRNEVASGGAVEAAYGGLQSPGVAGLSPVMSASPSIDTPSTMLVADSKMSDLATIEFVPPKGLDPWHGAVLLTEKIDDSTVAAWFSALAASEVITLRDDDGDLVMGVGPKWDILDPTNAAVIGQFFQGRSELKLGTYDPSFAAAWKGVLHQQAATVKAAGWWRRRPPGPNGGGPGVLAGILIVVAAVVVIGGSIASAVLGFFRLVPLALLFGLVVPSMAAFWMYASMLASRSAAGSSLAILTESFRRFLVASEGRHVEWAWSQGLLREYSAWAVALGAADAWGKALENSNVPPSAMYVSNPLLVHSMGRSFSSSHTAPSSSGSGGSSGGGVGGGGGGGSSGSG